MSRSDFWPISLTLIVAGVAYFVGGQKTAYGCIALGSVIVLYLLLTYKKKSASSSPGVTANQQMGANPQMTANPNMRQDVHLHLPASEKQKQPPLPPPKPKLEHNLRLHSCKMIQIEENLGQHGEMNGFHTTDDQSKPNAAVVCVKNKSKDGEVAHLHDVRAALVFRDSNGQEIGTGIDQAVWVNNYLRNASFDLEETKCVIVAVAQKDNQGKIAGAVAPYIREIPTQYGLGLRVEPYALENENLRTVEVTLLYKNSRAMEPMVFELFDDNGRPGIRLVNDEG